MHVDIVSHGEMVAMGLIPNCKPFSKIGYNGNVDNAEVDLWSVGTVFAFPTVAQQMEITSDSADDDSDGTGARTVKIVYLTSSFVEKTETVTLNGTGVVTTVATDIYRVNHFRVLTAGTGGKAAGNIDIRHIDNTPIYSRIAVGQTRARNAAYTVPYKKVLYISQLTYSSGAAAAGHYAKFTLRATCDDTLGTVSAIQYPFSEITVQDSPLTITYVTPMAFPAGTDMRVSCISDGATANVIATYQGRGWLESI